MKHVMFSGNRRFAYYISRYFKEFLKLKVDYIDEEFDKEILDEPKKLVKTDILIGDIPISSESVHTYNIISKENYDKHFFRKNYHLPKGNYNIEQMIDKLNELGKGLVKFQLDSLWKRVDIKSEYKVILSQHLKEIIGGEEYEMKRSIFHAYIYTNIIEPVRVGSNYSNVIRIIPLKNNKLVHKVYEKPQFFNVKMKNV